MTVSREWKDRSHCVCWKCLLHLGQLGSVSFLTGSSTSPIGFSEVHLWLIQEQQQHQVHCLQGKSQPFLFTSSPCMWGIEGQR